MRDGKMIISGSIDEITRQNNPSKTLKIELVSPSSNIMEVIEKIPSLSDLRMLDQSETIFEVTHCGDQSDAAHILANLSARRYRSGFLFNQAIQGRRSLFGN